MRQTTLHQIRSDQIRSHHLLAILSAVVVVPDKPGLEVNFDALSLGLEPGQLWPVYVMDAVDGAREDGVTHLCGATAWRQKKTGW